MTLTEVLLHAETLFQNISVYLNRVVIALVIILFGFIIGRIVESILRKIFAKIELDERFTKAFGVRRNYARAIRRSVVRIIYLITVIVALISLNVIKEVFTLLLVIIVFVVLTSFVLTGIEAIPNFVARFSLLKKFVVGDEVTFVHKTGVIQGTVVDITFSDVRIKRKNGDLFFIPNAVFIRESVVKRHR
jgi:small-conductance mechanosensitive channel